MAMLDQAKAASHLRKAHRSARAPALRKSDLARALAPLARELRKRGATWSQVAESMTRAGFNVSAAYLKKSIAKGAGT